MLSASRRGIQVLLSWIFSTLYVTLVLACALGTFGWFTRRWSSAAVRAWGRVHVWLSLVELEVIGAEHLEGRRPRVVVFNHTSLLDDFLVCALLPEGSVPVIKREVLYVPLIGWAIAALDFIALDRKTPERAHASLSVAARRIGRESLTVFIAPEGTRSRDGALLPFKLGALHLAKDSGAPIVPMVIEGARALQPYGRWAADPGRVVVRVLPPIPSDGLSDDNLRARADELRALYARELAATASS
jgi:1-acyl-sn-glycerol-3-phosphate acyltransferase